MAAAATPVHGFDDLFGGPARLLAARRGDLDLLRRSTRRTSTRARAAPTPTSGAATGRTTPSASPPSAGPAPRSAAAPWRAGSREVVHAHDWQAGLLPAYLHYAEGPRPGTVFTVHNLAFQGWAPASLLAELRLPPRAFSIDGVEFFGGIGALKAGLRLADRITTVSPTYAARDQPRPRRGRRWTAFSAAGRATSRAS